MGGDGAAPLCGTTDAGLSAHHIRDLETTYCNIFRTYSERIPNVFPSFSSGHRTRGREQFDRDMTMTMAEVGVKLLSLLSDNPATAKEQLFIYAYAKRRSDSSCGELSYVNSLRHSKIYSSMDFMRS